MPTAKEWVPEPDAIRPQLVTLQEGWASLKSECIKATLAAVRKSR
jgi:hypothetical protein